MLNKKQKLSLQVFLLLSCLFVTGCSCSGTIREKVTGTTEETTDTPAANPASSEPPEQLPTYEIETYTGEGDYQARERQTIASADDYEVALAIVKDVRSQTGTDLSAVTSPESVRIILRECGYQGVDEAWFVDVMQKNDAAYAALVKEKEQESTSHEHNYVGELDHENWVIHYRCSICGDAYDEPMEGEPFTYEAASPQTPPETSPTGYEFMRYTMQEYVLYYIVPELFLTWGENHYYWYVEEGTSLLHVSVFTDDTKDIIEGAAQGDPQSRRSWTELTEKIRQMSLDLYTRLDAAGYKAAIVESALCDRNLAQYYVAMDGRETYSYLEQLSQARQDAREAFEEETEGE